MLLTLRLILADLDWNLLMPEFARVKKDWYPLILSLHRFMVAIARESLNRFGELKVPLPLTPWFGIRGPEPQSPSC